MELLKELEGIIDNLTKKYNKIKEEKEALKKENEELYAEYENLTREVVEEQSYEEPKW